MCLYYRVNLLGTYLNYGSHSRVKTTMIYTQVIDKYAGVLAR